VRSQLGGRPARVVPLFVFSPGSAAHRALVGYKSAPSPTVRSAWCGRLEMMLTAFFAHHARCVVGPLPSALIVPVPSTVGGRPSWGGRHPLGGLARGALTRCPSNRAGAVDLRLAEVLRPGPIPPRRLEARAAGFEVTEAAADALPGAIVVILDDVFTSGARALSAAATLSDAGAHVAAVVPIGRLVRPDHNAASAAFWTECSRTPWHPGTCGECAPGTARAVLTHRSKLPVVTVPLAA
jgi:hypothetical protein